MRMRKRRGAAPPLEPVAGNGLLHRRALLQSGVIFAGALGSAGALTAAGAEPLTQPQWSLDPGAVTPVLQTPSRFESSVARVLSNPKGEPRTQHARAPLQMLDGTITPNSMHFTILHSGIPDIDPAQHRFVIHGMVRQPLEFTVDALLRYPMVTRKHFVECGGNSAGMFSKEPIQATVQQLHGLVSCAEWTGVPLSTILDEAAIDPKATWMVAEGADSLAVSRSVPLKKGYEDAIIAFYQNGERLMPGNGYPMRLLLPGYEGNMNTKFLRRILITDQPAMTFYETRNYSPLLPDGKAYRFYFVNEVKSFITKPSFGMSLQGAGYYEISGIAYSGSGAITKVLVSADGGKSWAEAAVEGPVSPKAFTRFRMPWRWDGQPVTLTSRAWDDSGEVQPLRADFVAVRGETKEPVKSAYAFPNNHYNSLTSWGVAGSGEIKHVYV
jgi:sulfane dehydrogenase subunit SoxC